MTRVIPVVLIGPLARSAWDHELTLTIIVGVWIALMIILPVILDATREDQS